MRGRGAGLAAKANDAAQSVKERLGVETKYVDVMIQVGPRYLLPLNSRVRSEAMVSSSVRQISRGWRS